jgi:hypothetical protein
VSRSLRPGVQPRYGKRPPGPTRRTGAGTAAPDHLGNHRRDGQGGHHDHPRPRSAVTYSDHGGQWKCSNALEHAYGKLRTDADIWCPRIDLNHTHTALNGRR